MRELINGISAFICIVLGSISILCLKHLYDGVVNELRKEYPDVWRKTGSFLPRREETLEEFLQCGHPLMRFIDQEPIFRKLLPASSSVVRKICAIKWVFYGTIVFLCIIVVGNIVISLWFDVLCKLC